MNKRNFLLILIIFLGFVLRFWHVDSIPAGLNRDEAAIGYNAFSLLNSGRDEYGKYLPLSFKSFGDWKLPLYIYLDILPIKLYSLTEISVRLPSIILGTAAILLVYLLSGELFKKNKQEKVFSLLTAFLLSLSPWHIHFSRVSSEANLSVFLVTFGLLFFIRNLRSSVSLFFSSILLALSLYAYHGSHVFIPLLFLGLVIILWKNNLQKKIIFFLLPFLFLSLMIFKQTLFSADKTKFAGLIPLSDKYLVYEQLTLGRLDHPNAYSLAAKLYHNKLIFLGERFITGYWRSFSSEFLFIKGGENWQHNIPDFGNLYVWEAPFIILGLYFIFKKALVWRKLLLFWLVISPIPAAITRDVPHSARMLSFLPLPHIFAAVGFRELLLLINFKWVKIFASVLAFFLIANFAAFLDRYFIHFPQKLESEWGGGYKELVLLMSSKTDKYSEIIMDRPDYSPYIYFLFYQKTDPTFYQTQVIRYSTDEEGFQHVKSIGNLNFKKLDWADDLIIPARLLISWAESTPKNATQSSMVVDSLLINYLQDKYQQTFGLQTGDRISSQLVKTISLKNGQPQFYLIEINKDLMRITN